MKESLLWWAYRNLGFISNFKWFRKSLGGHWERWLVFPQGSFGVFWFRQNLKGDEGGYTSQGLPVLRAKFKEENYK